MQPVSDIRATISQLAGDPLRPSPIHFLSSPIPRLVPQNDDPPEVQDFSGNPKPARGYYLIWLLFVISEMIITPPRMLQWVVDQMQLIEWSFNSDHVEVIMDLITKKGVGLGSKISLAAAPSGRGSE